MDNLSKSVISILLTGDVCKNSRESTDHLLLHCMHMTYDLWCCLFGIQRVTHERVVDLLACWMSSFGRHHSIEVWKAIPLCLMWTTSAHLNGLRPCLWS